MGGTSEPVGSGLNEGVGWADVSGVLVGVEVLVGVGVEDGVGSCDSSGEFVGVGVGVHVAVVAPTDRKKKRVVNMMIPQHHLTMRFSLRAIVSSVSMFG